MWIEIAGYIAIALLALYVMFVLGNNIKRRVRKLTESRQK